MKKEIAIVGEAWGEKEEKERMPFVGAAGYALTVMLSEAGIRRSDCFLTNVFNLRPFRNQIETLCGTKSEGIPGYPALTKGRYPLVRYAPELERLANELDACSPNITICLGNTASWALLGQTAISKNRGTTMVSTYTLSGLKCLPTYHPAAILRQWDLRPTTVIDLAKAKRESGFPEIRRPKRLIYIEPTLEDLDEFERRFLQGCPSLAVDIETSGSQITCIGFAPSRENALVVPFYTPGKKDGNYWSTAEDENAAWGFVRRVCNSPTPKVFQNGLYDIAFLWRAVGIRVANAEHDTMLLHHALQPEALKALGFLGSIYTDEGAWKQMRSKHTIKRDD